MTETTLVRVRDVMKTNFDTVDGRITVTEALNAMEHIESKCLIVNKRDENDEYGMVLISDSAKQVLAMDRSPDRVNVYEVMSKPVISVVPEMQIKYCARLFDNFGLGRAPVVEDGKVIGIVSYTDLVVNGLAGLTD